MPVKVTPETARFLRKECSVYNFAYSVGYSQLRQFSAKRITDGFYPYSSDGILHLVFHVYETADKVNDLNLTSKILSLVNSNIQHLAFCKDFSGRMRGQVQSFKPIMRTLFDPYLEAFEIFRKQVDGSDTSGNGSPIAGLGGRQPPTKPRAHTQDWEQLGSVTSLATHLSQGRVYMARTDGYGTLLSQTSIKSRDVRSTERNDDFKFKAGECFLVDMDIEEHNVKNKIVTNSKGEKGSVLTKILVPFVPQSEHKRSPSLPSDRRRPSISGRTRRPSPVSQRRRRRASVDRVYLDYRDYDDPRPYVPRDSHDVSRPGLDREERSARGLVHRRRSRSPARKYDGRWN